MKWREYAASKAVPLCGVAILAVIWGVFAYLAGADAVLLWGSETILVFSAVIWIVAGFVRVKRRAAQIEKLKNGLDEPWLLGAVLPKPQDATEALYFSVMQSVSRSAVGKAEDAEREKEAYCEYVQRWIHEIKTPLTACALVCDNGGDATKIKRELCRADDCADTILQYARLKSAEKDGAITLVHAADIVQEAIADRRALLIAAGIRITAEGDFCVHTDGKALGFVLRQLLVNCAKYCRGCRVSVAAANGKITVRDDGPGIPAHELPRLFDRGYTGALGRAAHGTGMGLYIVKQLCDRLGIEACVCSQEKKGTEFTLIFAENGDANVTNS